MTDVHLGDRDKSVNADSPPDEQETILPAAPGKTKTDHQTQKQKRKRGRPKKPREGMNTNPFGRHPTTSAIKRYLRETEQYYAPSTAKERARKLRYICDILNNDVKAPQSPIKIREEDIRGFIAWMDKKGLGNATQRKYLRFLKDYLAYYGNDIVAKMLSRRQIRVPSEIPSDIRSLSADSVQRIHEMTKAMNGWEGVVARFITMAYPYTGLRPSELRTMKFHDVDTEAWTLTVSHPKGENRYGKKRRIGILPVLKPIFKTFLMERKLYLEEYGQSEDYEALIPYHGRWGLDYWNAQQLNRLKRDIEEVAGVNFKLKDYRSTFCQIAIDKGANLQAVSKMMGHKTTVTTETYYGRIQDDTAIREIERAFTEPLLKI